MDQTLQKTKCIVLTGPESSGKTTLSQDLSAALNIPLVKEQSRHYLNQLGRPYGWNDLEKISELQHQKMAEAADQNSLFISDTDLLTMKIWGLDKFGKIDDFTSTHFPSDLPCLYILCTPDMPWEPDPLRENPDDRDRLFKIYSENLEQLNRPFVIVSGNKSERLNQALVFIREII